MKRQAFTLIELIIVLAIILILAAILWPIIFQPPREEYAGRSRCQSRLKLVALAMTAYTQDYDNRFPPAVNSQHGLDKPLSWAGVLEPPGYLLKEDVLRCTRDKAATDKQKSSYGYNAWLAQSNGKDVKHPATVVMLFEVVADANNWTQTGTGPQAVSARTRHLEGANYAFADGHVKWFKPEAITNEAPRKALTFRIR